MTVRQIYEYIDSLIPFDTQESWDNSGFLVGDGDREVNLIMTALDITVPVIREAREIGAELIVSHHPVIFHPLKTVTDTDKNPVAMLIKNNICAVCTHTPFDMSPLGMNRGLYDIMCGPLGLSEDYIPLEDCGGGNMIGRIYKLKSSLGSAQTAEILNSKCGFNVRLCAPDNAVICSVAISSGAGSSFVETAYRKGADALISGDIKHDAFITAVNFGISVFDCGHYGTEIIFSDMMKELLKGCGVRAVASTVEKDPVKYITEY